MWPKLLKWITNVTGLGAWTGGVTIMVGLLVAVGGIAGWLREDALSDCNARWKLELATRNSVLKDEVAAAAIKMKGLELKLAEALREADVAKENERIALEKQRETVPQTTDCLKCRVPNERLWRRPASSTRGGINSGS